MAGLILAGLAVAAGVSAGPADIARHECGSGPFDGDAGRQGDASDQEVVLTLDVPGSGVLGVRAPPEHIGSPGCYEGELADNDDEDHYELEGAQNATVRVLDGCIDVFVNDDGPGSTWHLNRCQGTVLDLDFEGREGAPTTSADLAFLDGPGTYRFHWYGLAGSVD